MTFPHFSVSSAISLEKSVGEPARDVPPRSANRAFILGSATAVISSLLSLDTMSVGVPFGAAMPHQLLASYPGTNSLMVGTLGNASERFAVVTAIARNLLDLTCSIDEPISGNAT